jgi:hypothetical protein
MTDLAGCFSAGLNDTPSRADNPGHVSWMPEAFKPQAMAERSGKVIKITT